MRPDPHTKGPQPLPSLETVALGTGRFPLLGDLGGGARDRLEPPGLEPGDLWARMAPAPRFLRLLWIGAGRKTWPERANLEK